MTEQETGDNVAGEGSRALTLDHSARLAGGFRWVEQRLFEVMGKWSLTYPDPSVQIFLDTHSLRHGWHADLWRDRLPVMAGSDPDAWTRPPGATAELFDRLGAEVGEDGSGGEADPEGSAVVGLAGLYRVVLPRLMTTYALRQELATPVADGPALRVLSLVMRDDLEEWLAGERLVEAQLDRRDLVERAHRFQAELEAMVVGTAPAPGLFAL
jgi:hypothetical protein